MDLFEKYVKNPKVYIGLASAFLLWMGRKYFNGPWTPIKKSMANKTVIITGCNSGIGLKTAEDLLSQGALVIFACRDEKKTQQAIETLPSDSQKRAIFIKLDLCDFNSVNLFAQEFRKLHKSIRIDILINNAGAFNFEFQLSKDNIEVNMQANHFGHKVLTFILFDLMDKKEARIINVASKGHYFVHESDFKKLISSVEFKGDNFNGHSVYLNSKLANIFFTQHLAEICENKYPYVKTACLHPGSILTEIGRNFSWFLKGLMTVLHPIIWYISKSVSAGAQTTLYLCYEDFEKFHNGDYYKDCKRAQISDFAKNLENRVEFTKWSYLALDKALAGKFELPKI